MLQHVIEFGGDLRFLNAGIALVTSSLITYIVYIQKLNFNTILKYTLISWGVGFVLGIVYIAIYDPNEAQGIFLSILITGPISWVLGMTFSVIKGRISLSRKSKE